MGGMMRAPKADPAALLQQQEALEAQRTAVEEQRQVLADQEAEQQKQRDRATAARKARQGAGGISLLANTEVGVDRAAPLQQRLGA
jgi:septal ring factor EnvC (AmiA/AmiB activator)